MYHLNLLSLLLISIALCIFYNEYNNKLTLPEICLFAIAFIAIVRAAYNYIIIDNKLNNKTNNYESFVSNKKETKEEKKSSTSIYNKKSKNNTKNNTKNTT